MENKLNVTPELLAQAKAATSAAALLALAQESGIAMTAEQAVEYYAALHAEAGALSDEELDNVSGGCGETQKKFSNFISEIMNSYCYTCQYYDPLRKPSVEKALSEVRCVCKACPNLIIFNDKAKVKGFKDFRRAAI